MSGEMMNSGGYRSRFNNAELIAQHEIAEELNATIEALRVSSNPSVEIESLRKLDLSPSDLRARLNAAFNVAINAQAHVEMQAQQGVDDTELIELQARADVVSKLVACMGIENKAVESIHTGKRKIISATEYKLDQVESFIDFFQTQDPVRLRAVQRVAHVGYKFGEKSSVLQSVIEKPLIAQTASALALTAIISFANNGSPAFAANEKTTTVPTQPGAQEGELLTRNVVKIIQNKVTPAVKKVDVTPPQTAPIVKKIVMLKENTPKTVVEVPPDPQEREKQAPIIIREKKQHSLEIKTLPPATQKNNVKVIPPAPVTPPTAPPKEQTPTETAPAPTETAPQTGVSAEVEAARQLTNMEGLNPKHTSWKNTGLVIEYLLNKKFTDSQAIGIVANMMWESNGVNPSQHQNGGPAFGLVQWEGGRRAEMEDFARKQGKPVDDLYIQLDFMMHELERDSWNGYAELKQAQNATQAMLTFEEKFERAGSPQIEERKKLVVAITDAFNAKLAAANASRQTAPVTPRTDTISQPENEVEPFSGWKFPVPGGYKVTSEFGPRGEALHGGFDLNAGAGVSFLAAAGGKVSVIVSGDVRQQLWCQKALAGVGATVADVSDPIQKEVHVTTVIDGVEYVTIYAHMSEVAVAPNQIVKAGEVLGKTGDSGCSTGPHAHFEVRRNGKAFNPRLLFDGDAWRGIGSVSPSSSTTENKQSDTGLDRSVGDIHLHSDGVENVTPVEAKAQPASTPQGIEAEIQAMQEILDLQKEVDARKVHADQSKAQGSLVIQH